MLPDSIVTPQPLPSMQLTVDGETRRGHPGPHGRRHHGVNSVLWIPSISTVLAGDVVFNNVHAWFGSSGRSIAQGVACVDQANRRAASRSRRRRPQEGRRRAGHSRRARRHGPLSRGLRLAPEDVHEPAGALSGDEAKYPDHVVSEPAAIRGACPHFGGRAAGAVRRRRRFVPSSRP